MTDLGDKIKAARNASGLKREELALQLGISHRTLQRWESGKTAPTFERMLDVARATGKPPAFFLQTDEVAA